MLLSPALVTQRKAKRLRTSPAFICILFCQWTCLQGPDGWRNATNTCLSPFSERLLSWPFFKGFVSLSNKKYTKHKAIVSFKEAVSTPNAVNDSFGAPLRISHRFVVKRNLSLSFYMEHLLKFCLPTRPSLFTAETPFTQSLCHIATTTPLVTHSGQHNVVIAPHHCVILNSKSTFQKRRDE